MMYVELYAFAANTPACDIVGHRFHFDAFSTVFDHPHEYYYLHVCQCVWIFVLIHFQECFQMIIFDAFSVKMFIISVWTGGLNA